MLHIYWEPLTSPTAPTRAIDAPTDNKQQPAEFLQATTRHLQLHSRSVRVLDGFGRFSPQDPSLFRMPMLSYTVRSAAPTCISLPQRVESQGCCLYIRAYYFNAASGAIIREVRRLKKRLRTFPTMKKCAKQGRAEWFLHNRVVGTRYRPASTQPSRTMEVLALRDKKRGSFRSGLVSHTCRKAAVSAVGRVF